MKPERKRKIIEKRTQKETQKIRKKKLEKRRNRNDKPRKMNNKDLPSGESDWMQEIARGRNFNIYCYLQYVRPYPKRMDSYKTY